ncbi:hypothetical protein QR680_011144 [Steinernema hermaphroditum]|uniref:PHD-type domain-containing protein n=1 Tax=Steinernema hermaphroditum TaxID=289476 RepID=A0AA39MCC6_9BILA|nr:hypothetical protein QR680_011144 [Steinernema hermaphroditum]
MSKRSKSMQPKVSKKQSARSKSQHKAVSKKRKSPVKEKLYCICRGPDVGTEMVKCDMCRDWFHFKCVGFTEQMKKNDFYHCPRCYDKYINPKNNESMKPRNKEGEEELYCLCQKPAAGRKMVMCDLCLEWYHFKCVGFDSEMGNNEFFHCPRCIEKYKNRRARNGV